MAVWNEVPLSEIEHNRVDSEFYRPEFICIDKKLSNFNNTFLKNISKKIDVGHVGSMVQYYRKKGISLIQTHQVNEFFLDLNNCVKITSEFHERLKKSQIKKGNILIARSGSFGKASIYIEEKTINSADIIIIDIEESIIKKGFLLAFLNSKYGSKQLIRFASGGVQGHVNLKILEGYIIPIFHDSEQDYISNLVYKSYELKKRSQALYAQAQELLEHELGLDTLIFEKSVGYEASLSEVMGGHRIDSQCYKPDYVNNEKFLRQNSNYNLLRSLVAKTTKGQQMNILSSGDINYVSIKDIKGTELISDSFCNLSKETCMVKKDNLLLAITGATIGKIGIVKRYENLSFSGDLLGLELLDNIEPHYFLVVMQSPIGHSQCKRWTTGSTNGHLAPNDVGKIVIPRLNKVKEKIIADKVMESLREKKESEDLLTKAKQQVEDLIEQAAGGT